MGECQHRDFFAHVEVGRLTQDDSPDAPVIEFRLDLTVECTQCKEPFYFKGFPAGYYNPHKPTVSVDGTEARLSIAPLSESNLIRFRRPVDG